jgi:hypothetical protein
MSPGVEVSKAAGHPTISRDVTVDDAVLADFTAGEPPV